METLWTQDSSGWFHYRDFAGRRLSGHKTVVVGSVTGICWSETLWTQDSSGWFRYRDFAGWRLSGHKTVVVGSITGTLLDGDSLDTIQ